MSMRLKGPLAERDRWHAEHCSVAKVLELLSTKTAFLILRECFYGTTRFDEFVARIGASAPAVSRALKQLESARIVERVPYREPRARARAEYVLTSAGEQLLPVLMAITQWGDAHLQGGNPPLRFIDARSGRPVHVLVSTQHDSVETTSDSIEVEAQFRLD